MRNPQRKKNIPLSGCRINSVMPSQVRKFGASFFTRFTSFRTVKTIGFSKRFYHFPMASAVVLVHVYIITISSGSIPSLYFLLVGFIGAQLGTGLRFTEQPGKNEFRFSSADLVVIQEQPKRGGETDCESVSQEYLVLLGHYSR